VNQLITYIKSNIPISDAAVEKVNSISIHKEIGKGEEILAEDSLRKQHIFVLDGCLRSFYKMDSGKEVTLQFAIKNWWIGDYMTLYKDDKSVLSIDGITKSEVLLIDKEELEQLYKEHPEFETFQRKNFERHIAAQQRRILSLLSLSAAEKYREFINQYPDFAQIIPNFQIASYLGITAESLSRVRKELSST